MMRVGWAILTIQQIADQRVVVGIRFSGLAPDAAEAAQVLQHQIRIPAAFRRHHRWRVTHTQLHKDGSSPGSRNDGAKSWSRGDVEPETPPILCRRASIRS